MGGNVVVQWGVVGRGLRSCVGGICESRSRCFWHLQWHAHTSDSLTVINKEPLAPTHTLTPAHTHTHTCVAHNWCVFVSNGEFFLGGRTKCPPADLPTFAKASPINLLSLYLSLSVFNCLCSGCHCPAYRRVRLRGRGCWAVCLSHLAFGLALSLAFAFGCLFVSVEGWLQIGHRWWRTYVYLVERLQCQNTCVCLPLTCSTSLTLYITLSLSFSLPLCLTLFLSLSVARLCAFALISRAWFSVWLW